MRHVHITNKIFSETSYDTSEFENYASELYYQKNYPSGLQAYEQLEHSANNVPSFTGGLGSFLKRQDGFADDSVIIINIIILLLFS